MRRDEAERSEQTEQIEGWALHILWGWSHQWQDLKQPVWLLFGVEATGIGRSKYWDDAQERIDAYQQQMPNAVSASIRGRNVLPYESTTECVNQLQHWLLHPSHPDRPASNH